MLNVIWPAYLLVNKHDQAEHSAHQYCSPQLILEFPYQIHYKVPACSVKSIHGSQEFTWLCYLTPPTMTVQSPKTLHRY